MSDTTIAILILPVLIVLTAALECTRAGCAKALRHRRSTRERTHSSPARQGLGA